MHIYCRRLPAQKRTMNKTTAETNIAGRQRRGSAGESRVAAPETHQWQSHYLFIPNFSQAMCFYCITDNISYKTFVFNYEKVIYPLIKVDLIPNAEGYLLPR